MIRHQRPASRNHRPAYPTLRADRLVDSSGCEKVNTEVNGKVNAVTAEKPASRTGSEILRAEVLVCKSW